MQIPSSCNYSLSNAIECNHSFIRIHIHSCCFRSVTLAMANQWTSEQLKARQQPHPLSLSLTPSLFLSFSLCLPVSRSVFLSLSAPLTACAPVSRKCVRSLNGNIFAECQWCPDNYCPLLHLLSPLNLSTYLRALLSLSLSIFLVRSCRRCCVLPASLMNWAWARAWSPSSFFMAMRQKQESLQHRPPTYHRQQRRPPPLLPFSFSSCQCVKMLAPASNRHAAKVSNDTRWMSGRGGTAERGAVIGRDRIERGEGGCWYSGYDRTFGLYPELWSGIRANVRLKAVWQMQNGEWRQRGTRNGSGTWRNRRRKVNLWYKPLA